MRRKPDARAKTTDDRIRQYEFFIQVVQESDTFDEVARKTGLSLTQVYSRYEYLKRRKVPLKSLSRRGKPINEDQWERLRKLAENCQGKQETDKYRRGA